MRYPECAYFAAPVSPYKAVRDGVVWLTPLVFPTIATSRQGIIDRSDIGSAGLTNKAPGRNCIYNSFLFLSSLMALYRSPIFLM